MRMGILFILTFTFPILKIVDHGNKLEIMCGLLFLIIFNEIFLAPTHAYLKNLFPMEYRYRGTSISFGIGMSLFGGITPLIESHLYHQTTFTSIGIWLAFICLGTLLIMQLVKRKIKFIDQVPAPI